MKIREIRKDEFERRKEKATKTYTEKHSKYSMTYFVVEKGNNTFDLLIHDLQIYDYAKVPEEDDESYKLEEDVTENWIRSESGIEFKEFKEVE